MGKKESLSSQTDLSHFMYDIVIVGGGPAGLAAAVYFARQKLSFAIVCKTVGGQAIWSTDVENYLGFHLLDGVALTKQFQKHLDDYKGAFDFFTDEEVFKIEKQSGGFKVVTGTRTLEAKTLLIATGSKHRTLGVPGEAELAGKGVAYCANCDAPLFAGRIVFVVGGGNSAMDAALFAAKYAKQVTIVTINKELAGDDVLKRKVLAHEKIRVYPATKVMGFSGMNAVQALTLEEATGRTWQEEVGGVIIEVGLQPVADFIDFVAKDSRGQIQVDKYNATSVEGIWAAGDVTDIMQKQISVAVGEGSKAALSIIQYLQMHH